MAPKVVYDTNVYISSFAFPGRPVGRLLDVAILRRIHLCVCPFILEEFRRVAGSKFRFSPGEIRDFEDLILSAATLIQPAEKVSLIQTHEEDNRILECAVSAEAEFLVTGDRKHILPLEHLGETRIVSPSDFTRLFHALSD